MIIKNRTSDSITLSYSLDKLSYKCKIKKVMTNIYIEVPTGIFEEDSRTIPLDPNNFVHQSAYAFSKLLEPDFKPFNALLEIDDPLAREAKEIYLEIVNINAPIALIILGLAVSQTNSPSKETSTGWQQAALHAIRESKIIKKATITKTPRLEQIYTRLVSNTFDTSL